MTALTTIEIRAADGTPQVLVPTFTLRVVAGPDAGKTFVAKAERIAIGTGDDTDLVLADKTVSRFHCEIALRGERIHIVDLGSRNGTKVDGVAIVHAFLHSGAAIALGETRLVFEVGDHPEVGIPLVDATQLGGLVGRSVAMRAAFARIQRAAGSDATVLIEGESGTGKELAAEAIHHASSRRDGPFVVVDCGAIPGELIESELFGHDKGAFTGALTARAGAFASAHGGTVFLDEIGELDLALQPKLLRVLERHQVKPVGKTEYEPVDVRVIAATNRDLRAEVNAKQFRSDLFYRLAVLDIRLPPLRERTGDIPLLVDHILGALGASAAEAELVRAPASLARLTAHPWPGNVRELRNHIERCLALGIVDPIGEAPPLQGETQLRRAKGKWERTYLEELLSRHGGNVSAAARDAGIDRKQLYKMLYRNGLR